MLLGSIKKEWELANLGAHSWGNCALSSNVYRQENYKRLQAFSSASCILQPSIQSPNTRYFHHQLDENLALWLKKYSGLHIVWAKEIFWDKFFERHSVLQAPFASTLAIIVLELPNADMRLHLNLTYSQAPQTHSKSNAIKNLHWP